MFNKKDRHMANSKGNDTIIAQGVKVEGDFHSDGNVVIDGELSGSLSTTQSLQIGESAIINANVSAQSAVVAGIVVGNVKVADKIELLKNSQVDGDIKTKDISVASGAKINGKITMGGKIKLPEKSKEKEAAQQEENQG